MTEKQYDWDAIVENPKFKELNRKKKAFLFGWWIFATLFYFLLPFGNEFAPNLLKTKMIGVINGYYVFALLQFVSSWLIALYYARVAKDFDRLTQELVNEIT